MVQVPVASFGLDAKVALVTGGASGIGFGIATVLAEAGATVVVADRDEPAAEQVVATLKEAGHKAGCVQVDLADEKSIVHACAEVMSSFGLPGCWSTMPESRTANSCWKAPPWSGTA